MNTSRSIVVTAGWTDIVSNLFFFIPLGFLFPLTRRVAETSPTRVFALGLVVIPAVVYDQTPWSDNKAAAKADDQSPGTGGTRLRTRRRPC